MALVLREVADRGEVSRARISAATGLTRATVSTMVDALVAVGLVRELGPDGAGSGGVGRPGSSLALASGPVGIGLEINVDYLATCTVDLTGAVRRRELVADDFRAMPPQAALVQAAVALQTAVDDARAVGHEVAGVFVAVAGLVEASQGLVRMAPNLGWRDVPVLDELAERTSLGDLRMRIDNEANLAALGELWNGGHARADGTPLASFVYIWGEVGIGAATLLNGELVSGTRGFGGEIGHLPLDRNGLRCECGARGCLEQYAGQEAVLRRAGLAERARSSIGRPSGPIQELLTLARAGDPRAIESIRSAGDALGIGLSVMVNVVDVDTVVLGGLYALLAPWMLPPLEEQLRNRVLSAKWDPVHVVVAQLGVDAAVRGAAMSVIQGVIDDPAPWVAMKLDAEPADPEPADPEPADPELNRLALT
jgi:predicted NBD/HSP70 family sugar kinase